MKMPTLVKKKMEDLQELRFQLQRAIQAENFEKAAELRDRIKNLEKKNNKE